MKDIIQYSGEHIGQNVQFAKDKLADLMKAVADLRLAAADIEDHEKRLKAEKDIEGLDGMIRSYRMILLHMDYAAHAYIETENSAAKLMGGLLHDE